MKTTKKAILKIIIILILIPITYYSVNYAWVVFIEKTQSILIYSGKIELEANLYYKLDYNLEYEPVTTSSINFDNVVPGETFYFMLEINSLSNIDSSLLVQINNNENNNESLASLFIINYIINSNSYETTLNNGRVVLLSDYTLEKNESLVIYFQITASSDITSIYSNEIITIDSILIKLDQIV